MKDNLGTKGNQGMMGKRGMQGIGKWFEHVDGYKQTVQEVLFCMYQLVHFAKLQVQQKRMKSSLRQVPVSCWNVFSTLLLHENF